MLDINNPSTLIGTIIVNVLALFGVLYTAKQGRMATEKATGLQHKSQAETEKTALMEHLLEQVRQQWERIDALDRIVGEQRDEIAELHHESAVCTRRFREAIAYICELRRLVNMQLPGHPIPPVPKSLEEELLNGD